LNKLKNWKIKKIKTNDEKHKDEIDNIKHKYDETRYELRDAKQTILLTDMHTENIRAKQLVDIQVATAVAASKPCIIL
jgi:hypothetical protein